MCHGYSWYCNSQILGVGMLQWSSLCPLLSNRRYSTLLLHQTGNMIRSRYIFLAGTTLKIKPISPVPVFQNHQNTRWISPSWLPGVATAELRRHMSNMKVIQRIWHVLLQGRKFPIKLTHDDCTSACEVTQKSMDEIVRYQIKSSQNQVRTLCIIYGIFCGYWLVIIRILIDVAMPNSNESYWY